MSSINEMKVSSGVGLSMGMAYRLAVMVVASFLTSAALAVTILNRPGISGGSFV